jgi:Fe-S-cluster containining protein
MDKLVRISACGTPAADGPSFSLPVCAQCRGPNCCEIAPPFLTDQDVRNIANSTGLTASQFAEVRHDDRGQPVYRMKQSGARKCHFYSPESRKCGIYENRPLDCRLFPLDIARLAGRFVWILYTSCPLDTPLAKEAALEMVASAEEVLLPQLGKNLEAYARCSMTSFEQGHWVELREVRL